MKNFAALGAMCLLAAACAFAGEADGDAYLFAYFRGQKDGLHLAYSYDGLEWTALNNNQSILRPTVGKDRLMRDPSICQGPDGVFHLVWTSSWYDKIIGYSSSTDLVHWTEQRAIPVMEHEPETLNSWAPELFYDDATGTFWIFWASSIPGRHAPIPTSEREKQWSHRIYATTTKDFQTFTPAKLWFDPDFMPIDAAVVKSPIDGRLIMVVKNENSAPPEKNLRIAYSNSMEAGFPKEVSAPINPPGDWVEGPSPLFVGKDLFVYYDVYGKGRYGLAVSSDNGKTWSDRSAELKLPKGIRHGTAFKTTRATVRSLREQFESLIVR